MSVQYRFARASDGALVDIRQLDPERRKVGAPYRCLGCDGELIPRLGSVLAHCFAHKHQACAEESYLHQLAKAVFFEEYSRCLRDGVSFTLSRKLEGVCDWYQAQYGFSCQRTVSREHDLTRYFDQISIEEAREGFRADILLWSTRRDDYVFVEFAVTHECEPEKLNSGIRIIEYDIRNDDDVDRIRSKRVDELAGAVRLYGFGAPQDSVSCRGTCHRTLPVFRVFSNGAAVLSEKPVTEIDAARQDKQLVRIDVLPVNKFGEKDWERYRNMIREAHFSGTPIRHCYMCRYHGVKGRGGGIFCRYFRRRCNSNEALKCPMFRAFATQVECDDADIANANWVLPRGVSHRRWREYEGGSKTSLADGTDRVPSGSMDRLALAQHGLPPGVYDRSLLGDALLPVELPATSALQTGKVVDFYLADGSSPRRIVWRLDWESDGYFVASLRGNGYRYPFVELISADLDALDRSLDLAFWRWVRVELPTSLIDSPMGWLLLMAQEPSQDRFPHRYEWSNVDRRWYTRADFHEIKWI